MIPNIQHSNSPYYLGIINPWAFIVFMATLLAAIILTWLLACGFLLNIPFATFFLPGTLGFIFGYVWGFFASSWAMLVMLEPNATNLVTFWQTLQIHITVAPVLYALHGLFFIALVFWGWYLFKGVLARTVGQAKVYVWIFALSVVILLTALIISLLFGDILVTYCETLPSSGQKKGWWNWFSRTDSVTAASVQEVASNIAILSNDVDLEASRRCRALADKEARTCWETYDLYKKYLHQINLEVLRLPSTAATPTGIQSGLATVTQQVLTPMAEQAMQGACQGAAERLLELGKK